MLNFECELCTQKTFLCADCLARVTNPTSAKNPWHAFTCTSGEVVRRARDEDDEDAAEEGITAKPKSAGRKKTDDEDDDDETPKKKRKGGETAKGGMSAGMMVLIGGVLLSCCLCSVVGIGVGAFILPAGVKVQGAAQTTTSRNNLKQIGLAMHGFHDAHKRLPFNGSNLFAAGQKYDADAIRNEARSGSWAFQLLPYMDQGAMFTSLDRTKGVPAYQCPGRGRPPIDTNGGAWTDYFINNYLNDPNRGSNPSNADMKRTLFGITDGSSNTVFVGHGNIDTRMYKATTGLGGVSSDIFKGGTAGTMRAGQDGAISPAGVKLSKDGEFDPTTGSWGGPFSQGALMVMCDGSVRTFPYTFANLNAALTPTGGEVAMLPD